MFDLRIDSIDASGQVIFEGPNPFVNGLEIQIDNNSEEASIWISREEIPKIINYLKTCL